MSKKYEFTGETKQFNCITLQRIRRLSDGLIGGWIESENNLSHNGSCFVYGEAQVYGEARVYGEAISTKPIPELFFKYAITLSDTHIAIGCENHTIAHWRKNIVSIGKARGYTNAEIKATIAIIKSVIGDRK